MKCKKQFKIPKDFYKGMEKIKPVTLPTFKCKVCGAEILDKPSNWIYKEIKR